jgi:shikimate 5-dehydrogenase
MSFEFQPAVRPTMYFIGVSTRQSSINAIFPRWAERLQLGDCDLRGLDFPLHADPQRYRAAVKFIKDDPLSLGALVTTHKIDLFAACSDQFDDIEPLSRSLGEISSIFKRQGKLHGRSVDPWTSGYALASFLPPDHWRNGADALILGAGGAGTALAWHLSNVVHGGNRPRCVHVIDRAPGRLENLRRLHATWSLASTLETHPAVDGGTARDQLRRLPPGSLIVNATGLGKDLPGSPLPDDARFPERAQVWDFNYRGNLVFLDQARRQQQERGLQIEDGWVFFIHGWTHVMADVFDRELPVAGPLFDELGRIAAAMRSV